MPLDEERRRHDDVAARATEVEQVLTGQERIDDVFEHLLTEDNVVALRHRDGCA